MAKSYDELLALVLENKAITKEIMKNGTEEEKEAFRKRQELYKRIANSKSKKTKEAIKEHQLQDEDINRIWGVTPAQKMAHVYLDTANAQKRKNAFYYDPSRRDYGMRKYIDDENFKKLSPETQEELIRNERRKHGKDVLRSEPSKYILKASEAEKRIYTDNFARDKERTTNAQKRIAKLKEVRDDLTRPGKFPGRKLSMGWSEPDENGNRTRIDLHKEVIKDFKKRHPNYVSVQEKRQRAKEQAEMEEIERIRQRRKDVEEAINKWTEDMRAEGKSSDTKPGTDKKSNTGKNTVVKMSAVVTAMAAVTAATVALLKKHNKNSKMKSLLKQAQDLQEKYNASIPVLKMEILQKRRPPNRPKPAMKK